MKYAVFGPKKIGGNDYTDHGYVYTCLDGLSDIDMVIVGGGRGVETFAEDWARERARHCRKVPPKWDRELPISKVFDVRNVDIISQSDGAIVFWDGADSSLRAIILRCVAMGKRVVICPIVIESCSEENKPL